ncbi:hypothetical protein [Orlajensenia flava]|nr:hypothetical protein [Glaciibacter flavus]
MPAARADARYGTVARADARYGTAAAPRSAYVVLTTTEFRA